MAISSHMVPLGTPAPEFALPSVEGGRVALGDSNGSPALLVAFICPHCPYVKHVENAFGSLTALLAPAGLATVGINSNDVAQYPDDDADGMRKQAANAGFTFPYLIDESQDVAHAYRAACTPDLFLYDAARRLAWRGQFDETRPSHNVPATGADLRVAVELVLAGKPVPEPHIPSMGCGIKWKPGNEPG
jgi:peroxiredoxin